MSGTPEVRGYRKLSEDEIERINLLKGSEQALANQIQELSRDLPPEGRRYMSEARTLFETGFMFAIKSIARPTNGMGEARLFQGRDGGGS